MRDRARGREILYLGINSRVNVFHDSMLDVHPPVRATREPGFPARTRNSDAQEVGGSERVLNRPIQEVAAPGRARLLNELAGEEVCVARIELHVTGKVVGSQ